MIVRENKQSFTMIEQHHHGLLARDLMENWDGNHFSNGPLLEVVMYAIEHHDRGWRMFDKQPFWNDVKNSPYTFTDFPILPKTTLYKQGIDEVEMESAYAALLCSEHYVRFMSNSQEKEAKQFVDNEKKRQNGIMDSLSNFDEESFLNDYDLLQFADNLSLYICLNEPGVSKEDEHFFFREGIPAPTSLLRTKEEKVQAHWHDESTICLSPFPFSSAFQVTFPAKLISRQSIAEIGILKTYEKAKNMNNEITLQSDL